MQEFSDVLKIIFDALRYVGLSAALFIIPVLILQKPEVVFHEYWLYVLITYFVFGVSMFLQASNIANCAYLVSNFVYQKGILIRLAFVIFGFSFSIILILLYGALVTNGLGKFNV